MVEAGGFAAAVAGPNKSGVGHAGSRVGGEQPAAAGLARPVRKQGTVIVDASLSNLSTASRRYA